MCKNPGPVYFFGAGKRGKRVAFFFSQLNIPVKLEGFLDNDAVVGSQVLGYPVYSPDHPRRNGETPCVVITSPLYSESIRRDCRDLGYACISLDEFFAMIGQQNDADFHFLLDQCYPRQYRDKGGLTVINDYPYIQKSRGVFQPLLELLDRSYEQGEEHILARLGEFIECLPRLKEIQDDEPGDAREPYWNNQWITPFDAISIYCMLAIIKPKRYVEIGSGNTTKFAARSIRDNGLATEIISIDPHPRSEIDELCSLVHRCPLEKMDMGFFESLTAQDMLIMDSSHRSFSNSDVTVFFTEILPVLPADLYYALHDIYLPYDYPAHWIEEQKRYYNEQYLLAAYLLGGGGGDSIELPLSYLDKKLETKEIAGTFQKVNPIFSLDGGFFWMRRGAARSHPHSSSYKQMDGNNG